MMSDIFKTAVQKGLTALRMPRSENIYDIKLIYPVYVQLLGNNAEFAPVIHPVLGYLIGIGKVFFTLSSLIGRILAPDPQHWF
jgi:hypothetical protein